MASTNKTTHLLLNQWQPEDPVLREDFNADNAKIDAAVAAKCEVVFGAYQGNSEASRFIDLGFTPSAVLLIPDNGAMSADNVFGGLFTAQHPLNPSNVAAEVEEDGFRVYHNDPYRLYTNRNNRTYYYLAFR